MTNNFKSLIVVLLLLPILAFSSQELVDLYALRMSAEADNNTTELVSIDAQLAQKYLNMREYSPARYFLESAIALAQEPQLSDLKLDLYRLDIIEGEFDRAESGLITLYFYNEDQDQRSRASYLLGLLNALKGQYHDSRKYLCESLKISGDWTPEFEKTLDEIMKDARKRKNRETAKWMSTFLPGSGQIYAQNAKGAIGAIGIAAFWGAWFAYDIAHKDYYSAALILLWPWQRYHRGNIQNAEFSVDDFNAEIEDQINRELLEYLGNR